MAAIPSSNKTLWLELNKWAGSDKPKKDDFNADNQKIDDAYQTMDQTLTKHSTQLGGIKETIETLVQSASKYTQHQQDAAIHITNTERLQWNQAGAVQVGTYSGNGAVRRTVSLGYEPKFGVVFAVGHVPIQVDFAMQTTSLSFGFFTKQGGSDGVTVESDGFSVAHTSMGGMDGHRYKLNESGVTYIYAVWK